MDTKEKSKNLSLWIKIPLYTFGVLILLGIISTLINTYNQPDKDITFVIPSEQSWTSCYNNTSNITINYDLSSSSAVDLMFTPTKEDAENLNETSQHYPSCYSPNVLNDKGNCVIAGKGCMVLRNKNTNDATINLKYSARTIG